MNLRRLHLSLSLASHRVYRRLFRTLGISARQRRAWRQRAARVQPFVMALLSFGLSLLLTAAPVWGTLAPLPRLNVSQQSSRPGIVQDQAGRLSFAQGEFAAAARQWKGAAQAYQAEGNLAAQAQALSNLALAYQRLGQYPQAKAAIAQSLQLLQHPSNLNNSALQARVLTTQGSLQLGPDTAAALKSWTEAEAAYKAADDEIGVLRSQLNQAQALQKLGFYQRSLRQLTQITEQLQTLRQQPSQTASSSAPATAGTATTAHPAPLATLHITALQRLASLHRVAGSLNQSQSLLQQSFSMAEATGAEPQVLSHLLLEQGETEQALGRFAAAIALFDQAAALQSEPTPLALQIQQAQLRTHIAQQNDAAVARTWPQIMALRDRLLKASGPNEVGADLDFATTLLRIGNGQQNSPQAHSKSRQQPQDRKRWDTVESLLTSALREAQAQGDQRAEAIALGLRGELYEQQQQWPQAKQWTEAAIKLTEQLDAPELGYRWQWHLGYVLNQQGQKQQAVAAYSNAVQMLNQFEGELVQLNPGVQFSLRTDVDPVYRQLIDLLLSSESAGGNTIDAAHTIAQNVLGQAQQTLDQMRSIELGSFLGEPCSSGTNGAAAVAKINELDPTAAIIAPVILADRVEVLLQLPNGHLDHYASPIAQPEFEKLLRDFRYALTVRSRRQYLVHAQRLYNLLLRPLEKTLKEQGIKTLVFSLDSALNSIPITALHNGERFLIEDYKVALTPGLELMGPQPLQNQALQTLAVGLTEAREGFEPLNYVEQEMQAIANHAPSSTVLIDQDFTQAGLRQHINNENFPIVHIATHGQFSSDPSDTFLLAWDDPIQVRTLDQMLQARGASADRAIELLILSACQTAVGDERAALGMAGTAIKAGARSTIATLWAIDDQATSTLMDEFYGALSEPSTSRAEALQMAQVKLLQHPKYGHPIYWSPYILLGNWL